MLRRALLALTISGATMIALNSSVARADAVDDLHQAGLQAARRGDWSTAKVAWMQASALLEHPDPRIEFELGTAYAKLDELGPAILHLRVAAELATQAQLRERAQLNLGIARRRAELAAEGSGARVAPPEPWTERVVEIAASDLVAWLCVLLVWLASLSWIGHWLLTWRAADLGRKTKSSEATRARLHGLALAGTVAAALLLPPHIWSRTTSLSRIAVVVVTGPTPLLEGPSPRRNTTAVLAPGAEAWVDASQAGWVHVVLRDKTSGWAPRAVVEPVRVGQLGRADRSAIVPLAPSALSERNSMAEGGESGDPAAGTGTTGL